jgi:hypothetical protein
MATTDDETSEPRARDLVDDPDRRDELDPATRAQLERWFGMPSYQQLEEEQPDDPELVELRERRARACAAVDPALVDKLNQWTTSVERLLLFHPLDLEILDPSISAIDEALVQRAGVIADPREVEVPFALIDDLKECTPQAVLRDLHRPETLFAIRYEVDQMVLDASPPDVVAEIRAAMRTRIETRTGPRPLDEARAALDELAAIKRRPWLPIQTPNRRVEE